MTETIYQLLDRIQDQPQPELITAGSSLELLQAVYMDPGQPMSRRMRAAIAALPFENPKLAVQALAIAPNGFAAQLERARARIIDAKPVAPATSGD
jgi:hypothetical protein